MKAYSIVETPASPPQTVMAADEAFLKNLASDALFVHFYQWEGDCATYGYFVDPEQYLNLAAVRELGLKIARRPTGGGVIFHAVDFAFSVLIGRDHPAYRANTLQSYELVNRWVGGVVERVFGVRPEIIASGCCSEEPVLERFCMAKPTQYDLVVQGRKVGGAAQRRTKHGILHQGTVCLTLPAREYLQAVLLDGITLADAMYTNSFPLLGSCATQWDVEQARQKIRVVMRQSC